MFFVLQTDQANNDNLVALENLMNEFFLPTTTNERKRNIGKIHHVFYDPPSPLFLVMNSPSL